MDLEKIVYEYPTKNKEGFIEEEMDALLSRFPKDQLNMDKWYGAMMGNTCMMRDGKFINYHCDVLLALKCALENREPTIFEWD